MKTRGWNMGGCIGATVAVFVIVMAGCVKRTETFRIQPDGRINLSVRFEGDPDDFIAGDPMLDGVDGWKVRDERTKDSDGKEQLVRTAERVLAPGEPIPDSYAGPGDANADVGLKFPTALTIERRSDGVYYHFKRVYRARRWAYVNYRRDDIFNDGVRELADKDADELTGPQKETLVRAMIAFEAVKAMTLADQAAEELSEDLTQDQQLAVHAAVERVFRDIDIAWAVNLITSPDDEERVALEAAKLAQRVNDAIERALRESGAAAPVIALYAELHDQAMRRYRVTEDLDDETWEVRVVMPGVIVGHNGQRSENGTVEWEFDGPDLHDRDQVLMATSRRVPE